MKIETDKVVTLTYSLSSNPAGEEAKFVEEAGTENPLIFLFGHGNMIPKFEQEIEGMQTDDAFSFSITSADAYGQFMPDALVHIPMDVFIIDGKPDTEILQVGKMVPMRNDEGQTLNGKIKSIEKETVLMDFNHPLAGHDLHFTGKITEVRLAKDDELSHGHVHGDHCHH
ncbi:MAG: FKBP-type peptidyl-prolyl cis-trans isomerase [Bacteroidia bacterium]|nr:FKBP-type peptidyl-prolyl cis-trans isomerase [Bacteroidia bacterium]